MELLIMALLTALLLLVEHIALWVHPWRLSRPQAYALGTGTITAGYTGWAFWIGVPGAAVGLWVFVVICGMTITIAYYVRRVLADLDRRAFDAGQASAPLQQSDIDRGAGHAENTPR